MEAGEFTVRLIAGTASKRYILILGLEPSAGVAKFALFVPMLLCAIAIT